MTRNLNNNLYSDDRLERDLLDINDNIFGESQFEQHPSNIMRSEFSSVIPRENQEHLEVERARAGIVKLSNTGFVSSSRFTMESISRTKAREGTSSGPPELAKRRKLMLQDRKSPHILEELSTSSPLDYFRVLFGPGTKHDLNDRVLTEIIDMCQNFIRPDLLEYLEEALPRWQREGFLLQEQLPETSMKGSGQAMLFNVYSFICRLEARIGDDQVRNRAAVIMLHKAYEQACIEWRTYGGNAPRKRKGRGDASSVIDDVLERWHDDWNDNKRKIRLRSRFHDKKRYGKRWLVLTSRLGMSLLMASSAKIVSAV